ncbi:MAG: hypothetical protein IPP71_22390 [Bacteroidetes bacterium]|nr:hypothetical protein [Bacteroidota bacterium]
MVGGVTESAIATKSGNVQYLSAIKDEEFVRFLHPDTLLICRPGYSTLMDLVLLGHQKVVFIPTPGQTEQEYLGALLVEKFNYFLLNQEEKFPITEIRKGKKINIFVDPLKLKEK